MPYSFQVVATDYDGTLTVGSRPEPFVLDALAGARAEGRRIVLVTGRILDELRHVFPDCQEWFDAIVAENGAVLWTPSGRRLLSPPVPPVLEDALNRRGVPVRGGEVILACDAAHDAVVLDEVRRLGLDCQLSYNRAALMVLPAGVTKGTGLHEALGDLGVSHHSAIGVGDAENDLALLEICELGVAVANAVPSLRDRADVVLDQAHGEGVAALLAGPVLQGRRRVHPRRWQVPIGRRADGSEVTVPGSQVNVLVTGGSRAGKSYVVGLFTEGAIALGYSVLVVDFEGDHTGLAALRGVLLTGGAAPLPPPEEVVRFLRHRFGSVILDLSMLAPADQDIYLDGLRQAVATSRHERGLPHWIVVDEAHRSFPPGGPDFVGTPGKGYCLATWQPQDLHPDTVEALDVVLALPSPEGDDGAAVDLLAAWVPGGREALRAALAAAEPGQGLLIAKASAPELVTLGGRSTGHVRHWHKYARAELSAAQRFHFRRADGDPTGRVAANLYEFHHILRQADDTVIGHHTAHHDFSRWALQSLQDADLAAALAAIEDRTVAGAPNGTRGDLLGAIEARYLG
jgi:hydroxymethylpyrimidine pyrophosphatase-like HAD family hydrolase